MAKFALHKIRPNKSAEYRLEGTTFRIITGKRLFAGAEPPASLEMSLPSDYAGQFATADVAAAYKAAKRAEKDAKRAEKDEAKRLKAEDKEKRKAEKLRLKQEAAAKKEEARAKATEAARAKATEAPQPSL